MEGVERGKRLIEKADQQVKQWLEGVAGQAPVWLAPGEQAPAKGAAALHLLGFADALAPRGPRQTPSQIRLRYLIAASGETPEAEHRLLGKLLFAALDHPEWEVDLAPLDVAHWQALGMAPRPSFALLVPLRSDRAVPEAPRVGVAPRLRTIAATPLRGRLVAGGGANVPLTAARVELLSLGTSTETDADGNFFFGLVPRGTGKQQLRVIAHGEVQDFTIEVAPQGGGPVTIVFEPREG